MALHQHLGDAADVGEGGAQVIGAFVIGGEVAAELRGFARELRESGKSVVDSALEAAETRLRPIVMTSVAMIAGMLPVAIECSIDPRHKTRPAPFNCSAYASCARLR